MEEGIAGFISALIVYGVIFIFNRIKDAANDRPKFEDMSKDNKKENDDWN